LGWGIIEIKKNPFFIVNLNTLVIYNKKFVFKSFKSFLNNYSFGLCSLYNLYLKLKGMGYKLKWTSIYLVLKLGYSHRIMYKLQKDLLIKYYTRFTFCLSTRTQTILKNFLYKLQKIGKNNCYKKKGIFIKSTCIKLKVNSKKSKF